MPKLLKVAQRKKQPDPGSLKVSEVRSPFNAKLPKRIAASPTASVVIPYVARAIMDANRRLTLTPLQDTVVRFFKARNLDRVFMRRFEELPKQVRAVFDQKYLKDSAQIADTLFRDALIKATTSIITSLAKARSGNKALSIDLGFSTLVLTNGAVTMLGSFKAEDAGPPPPPPPPSTYDFKLEYRGITTLKANDRSGGVEPYLIAGFYRLSDQQALEEAIAPFVIKQQPANLGDMDPGCWMPSGGTQDANGNPSNPVTMFAGEFPPYFVDRLYYSIIKVMEEDGGQGSELAEEMGNALIGIAPMVVGAGVVTAIGAVPATIVAAIIVGVGLALDLLGLIWSSSDADDPVGDIVLVFGPSDIRREGYVAIQQEVASDDNDWILYFGVTSKKITA